MLVGVAKSEVFDAEAPGGKACCDMLTDEGGVISEAGTIGVVEKAP